MSGDSDIKFGITLGGNATELVREVRLGAGEFDKLKSSTEDVGESASKSFRKMSTAQADFSRKSSAYNALQIRSNREINREIKQVQAAYKRLGADGSASASDLGRASVAVKQRIAELNDELKGTSKETQGFASQVKGLFALGAIFYGIRRGINASEAAIISQNSAMMGLSSVAKHAGISVKDTLAAGLSLSADGMMSNTEAAKALKNLLARGFGLNEAIQIINRFRDSAAFGRQASLNFGEAVVSATEGIKNENSILVDNAGVTKNVSVMWKEYSAQIGVSVNSLSIAQKRQAELNGILKETEGQLGNAAQASRGLQGAQARMAKSAMDAKAAFGSALTPALTGFYDTSTLLLGVVKELPPYLPEIATGLAFIAAQSVIARLGLAGMTLTMGTATLAAKGLAKALLPLAAAEGVLQIFQAGSEAVGAYGAHQEAAAAKTRNTAQSVAIFTKYLLPASAELKTLGLNIKRINPKNIEQVTAALRKLNAVKRAQQPIAANDDTVVPGKAHSTTPLNPKLVAQSLKDAQSLTTQLGTAFDDTFTKTSAKYTDTWQQLVQTHGEGSAQVKSLESAYQQWLNSTWDQQAAKDAELNKQRTDKEQEHVNNVIDLQSAKYVRLNEMATDSVATDAEREFNKLERDFTSMEDDRQRLIDQKIWTEELEATYDQARIDRAQLTANALGTIEDANAVKVLATIRAKAVAEAKIEQAKHAFVSGIASAATALMQTKSRAAFETGKAASIAIAGMKTYEAAQNAYASASAIPYVGWILGPIAAGAAVIAGAANVQKISGMSFGGSASVSAAPAPSIAIPSAPTPGAPSSGGSNETQGTTARQSTNQAPENAPRQMHVTFKSDTGFIDPNSAQQFMDAMAPYMEDSRARGQHLSFGGH